MDFTITRQSYIPTKAVKIDTILGIEAYRYYNEDGSINAVCFVGKTIKPTWRYKFESEAVLTKYLDRTIEKHIAYKKNKSERAEQRKADKVEAINMVAIGDVFVECFSYEYTTVDFWQVISKRGAKLELKKIARTLVHSDSSGRNEDYMPNIDNFIEDEKTMTRSICSSSGESVYLIGTSRSLSYTKWNGKPQYETNSYWR